MDEENRVGENPKKMKTASVEANYKASSSKKYAVTFRQNRSFDLHIGKKVIRFNPKETIEVESAVVDHPDFKQSAKYFVVKEI